MFNEEGSAFVRSVALFCSIILVLAIVSWNMTIASANPVSVKDPTSDKIDINRLTELISVDNSKIEKIEVKDGKYIVHVDKKTSVSLTDEELAKVMGMEADSPDSSITVKTEKGERQIPVKNFPADLESIEVNKETGQITYVQKAGDGTAKVVVSEPEIYLQEGDDGGAVVHGFKVGKEENEREVKVSGLSKGDVVNISSESGKASISYKGKTVRVDVDGIGFQPNGDGEGSVEFQDDGNGFNFKNSKIEDTKRKIKIAVGDESIYYGDGPSAVKDSGKAIYFKDGKLEGDVTAIKEMNLMNDGDEIDATALKAKNNDGEVVEYNAKIGKGSVKVVDGKIDATKDGVNMNEGTEPELPTPPTAGDPSNGDGTTTPNGTTTPPITPPTTPGDPGDSGSSNWLMWVLLIGAGILAAMMLLGGKKDDKAAQKDNKDGVDDGGAPYMGHDNATDVHTNVTDDEVDKVTTYNPTEPEGRPCTCNESGCFMCPNDNCYACTPRNNEAPTVQVAGDDNGSTSLASSSDNGSVENDDTQLA